MTTLKQRITSYYQYHGTTTPRGIVTSKLDKTLYMDLSKQDGIDQYLIGEGTYSLWVDHNNVDSDGYPETALAVVWKENRFTEYRLVFPNEDISAIRDTPVKEMVEQAFEGYFTNQPRQAHITLESGTVSPLPQELLQDIKKDELIHSAVLIDAEHQYVRVNFLDKSHLLYVIPASEKIQK